MKNSEANKSKGSEMRDTIIYLAVWIIGFGLYIIGVMYFLAIFTGAIPSKKDIRERNIEILDAARIYKGEEYTYTTLDYLEQEEDLILMLKIFLWERLLTLKELRYMILY